MNSPNPLENSTGNDLNSILWDSGESKLKLLKESEKVKVASSSKFDNDLYVKQLLTWRCFLLPFERRIVKQSAFLKLLPDYIFRRKLPLVESNLNHMGANIQCDTKPTSLDYIASTTTALGATYALEYLTLNIFEIFELDPSDSFFDSIDISFFKKSKTASTKLWPNFTKIVGEWEVENADQNQNCVQASNKTFDALIDHFNTNQA